MFPIKNHPERIAFLYTGRKLFGNNSINESNVYVYTLDIKSELRVPIVKGFDPSWSSGQLLVYASAPGEISVADVNGNNVHLLTNQDDWQPNWAPDGQQIVFVSGRTGKRHIYTMNVSGESQLQLTDNLYEDRHPAWSTDGSTIAFISNRSGKWQIWLMSSDGSNERQITDAQSDYFKPTWSPNGEELVFGAWAGSRNEIRIVNKDGSGMRPLVTDAVYKLEGEGYGLAWSRSGWIAYVSNKDGRPQIYTIRTDRSESFRVTNSPENDFFPV